MLVDPRNPRMLWVKLVTLCLALAGVIWAIQSLSESPTEVQPKATETK